MKRKIIFSLTSCFICSFFLIAPTYAVPVYDAGVTAGWIMRSGTDPLNIFTDTFNIYVYPNDSFHTSTEGDYWTWRDAPIWNSSENKWKPLRPSLADPDKFAHWDPLEPATVYYNDGTSNTYQNLSSDDKIFQVKTGLETPRNKNISAWWGIDNVTYNADADTFEADRFKMYKNSGVYGTAVNYLTADRTLGSLLNMGTTTTAAEPHLGETPGGGEYVTAGAFDFTLENVSISDTIGSKYLSDWSGWTTGTGNLSFYNLVTYDACDNARWAQIEAEVAAIPEPATMCLMAAGLLAVMVMAYVKRYELACSSA